MRVATRAVACVAVCAALLATACAERAVVSAASVGRLTPAAARGLASRARLPLPAALAAKVAALEASTPRAAYPIFTLDDGTWQNSELWRWSSGFLPSSLWLCYELTGDDALRVAARRREAPLPAAFSAKDTMDVGLGLVCSYGNDCRLTGDDAARAVLVAGAKTLAKRYESSIGVVRTTEGPDGVRVAIDTMMNIELLYLGAANGGGDDLREIASNHALRTIRDHMRADGSTFQYVTYEEKTGTVLGKSHWQGAADDSTWARGQAWAIYGLAVAYRETGDERFLEGVHRVTDYWATHVPEDLVPYWDFDAPGIPNAPRDSSAAATAASAFAELARTDPDPARRAAYADLARRTVASLSSPEYFSADGSFPALLKHGSYFVDEKQADHGTAWGDYYFLEALVRLNALAGAAQE